MITQEVDVFEIMIECRLQKAVLGLQIFLVTFLVRCFTRLWWDITFFFTEYCYEVDFTEAVIKAWINLYLKILPFPVSRDTYFHIIITYWCLLQNRSAHLS